VTAYRIFSHRFPRWILLLPALLLPMASVWGQAPDALIDALRKCRAIEETVERLSCFDRATQGLDETVAEAEPEPTPQDETAPVSTPTPQSDRDAAREAAVAEQRRLERQRERAAAEQRELAREREELERQRRELERRAEELASRSEEIRGGSEPEPADPEAAFGADQLPDYDQPMPEEKLNELETRIVGAAQKPTGEWVMTLANGQVWVQTQPEFYPLDLSDGPIDVVFFRNIFGSFYMRKADENVRLRVRRIQ